MGWQAAAASNDSATHALSLDTDNGTESTHTPYPKRSVPSCLWCSSWQHRGQEEWEWGTEDDWGQLKSKRSG